jgi:SAM-dependent methyltransferase
MAEPAFFSPRTHQLLRRSDDGAWLEGGPGERYRVLDGIPELLLEAGRDVAAGASQEYYRTRAAEYDAGMEYMFRMLLADEAQARESMIDMLQLRPGARVLEIGCGTCRDTAHLLRRAGELYAGDLSQEMVFAGRARLQRTGVDTGNLRLCIADAAQLPFPDGYFDAVYHFGGLNLFPDIGRALAEMARVTSAGGRVVAGDEGVGPWLGDSDFARILKNSNPLFDHTAPVDKVPAGARDVSVRWVLNGAFYVISFEVADGAPGLDLDARIPGARGGSHRTRFYGRLEGVSPELRERVIEAAAAEGLPVTDWLERELGRALDR